MFCRCIGWYINPGIGSTHRLNASYSAPPLGTILFLDAQSVSVAQRPICKNSDLIVKKAPKPLRNFILPTQRIDEIIVRAHADQQIT